MHRVDLALGLSIILLVGPTNKLNAQQDETQVLDEYRHAAMNGGDPARGKAVFESKEAGCQKCHVSEGVERRVGPDLRAIGDRFGREQLNLN